MTPDGLHSWLEEKTGRDVRLIVNRNRSTMVSVRWAERGIRVSLHEMFLNAPKDVLERLLPYVKGTRRKLHKSVDAFINEELPKLDYGHLARGVHHQGVHHHLGEIYERLNQEYFEGALDLQITWYGTMPVRSKRSVTFGLFSEVMKLVKIHRILDAADVPPYVVEFVVYHEMLHHVARPYLDDEGRHKIHNPEFKMRERQFREYELATEWVRDFRDRFFAKMA